MSDDDRQHAVQWGEARLWLAKAAEDIAGARVLLAGGLIAPAAFHVQQATEKALKALLVAAAEDVRRVHDITTLAALVRPHWPELLPSPFPLIAANEWYVVTRYPGIEEEEPTRGEVEDALHVLDLLMAAILVLAPPHRSD